tara:strand:+ start:5272 stop:6816 length:1545 start_codon:yes stop_codon:yes gene_type:complete
MAINLSFLGAVAGAAQGYSDRVDSLRDELKDNKRKQREWLATYGNKALDESNKKQETVTSALDDLKARGLKVPDAIQLLQKHGAGAVLELQRYIKNYEETNNTKVDEVLMNKLWTAAEDFTTEDRTFEDAVNTLFGSPKDGATAPVIQEVEDRNFFERIKYNMGDRYEDEYEDFLSDPTEGIGGKSIKELKALSVVSPSMLGTEGSAVFDRSVLKGSGSSPSDRDEWKQVRSDVVLNAVLELSENERREITTNMDGETLTNRSTQDQFALLKIRHPEVLAEATRKVGGGLSENPAAWTAYGGQDALNTILNPPPPPDPLTPEELADQLDQDLIDNSLTEARPEDLGEKTDAEIGEWFRDNNKDFVIANGELRNRDPDAPFDESQAIVPVLPTDYDENTFELKMQPTTKPEGVTEKPVVETNMLGGMSQEDRKKLSDWNRKYGGKFNDNGTYKLVRPRPVKPTNFNELERDEKGRISNEIRKWDRLYKDTHNPETGYPDLEGLDNTLIPNSEVTE